ncbi:MAG: thiamine diphosphokinase, partial [Chloroflexi bacterium]|nr:thiamine diphosphokinase [Chloroflexota bacterium]
ELQRFRSLLQQADLRVAADGGARYLLALDLLPHIAVGDFDSLVPEQLELLERAGVEVQRHSVHKNETDLELALLQAIEHGATCIYVLAALGGRPDQHLANLQLLTHPALAQADVRMLHERWELFAIRQSARIYGAPGDIVSLLPMTDEVAGIVTDGLYYPLRDESLSLGPARGVSNVLVGQEASISVRSGILLCMHELPDSAEPLGSA